MNKAQKEQELKKLAFGICRCHKCRLHKSRKRAVPGEGDPSSGVVFIGEAPGKKEDQQGRPFVGMSGKFLDSILMKIGLSRKDIYITSSVKCRPINNRAPYPDELKICKDNWLDRQIKVISPKIVVILGKVAMCQVLGRAININTCHGEVIESEGIKYVITFHPAAAMRFPATRKKFEEDIKKIIGKIAPLQT